MSFFGPQADYRRITYDFTLAAASVLARLNPAMTFVYVSGAGTDGTGKGGWLFPVLRRVLPAYVTTTEELARAMLRVAREGAPERVLENSDIARYGRAAPPSSS